MDITPEGAPQRSTRKAGLIGGLIGSAGLAASIFALTATAGAATPTLTAQQSDDSGSTEPAVEEVVTDVDAVEDGFEFPEEFQAAEECVKAVFEKFDMDFDAMMSGEDLSDTEAVILHEADWDALDAEAETCNELLPEEIQAEMAADEAAWDAHEICVNNALEAAGIDIGINGEPDDFDDAYAGNGFVSVFDIDEETFASFGDGDATITITKVGDDVTVTTDGDVKVEIVDIATLEMIEGEGIEGEGYELSPEDAELEKALDGCDDQLPEGFDDIYLDEAEAVALEN